MSPADTVLADIMRLRQIAEILDAVCAMDLASARAEAARQIADARDLANSVKNADIGRVIAEHCQMQIALCEDPAESDSEAAMQLRAFAEVTSEQITSRHLPHQERALALLHTAARLAAQTVRVPDSVDY